MFVQLQQPLPPPLHLWPWLHSRLPGFKYVPSGANTTVNYGSWAQVIIKPKGYGVELETGFPILPRLLMLLFIFGGLLPGILFVIVYYVAIGGTHSAMQRQLAAALQGQQIPPGPGAAYMQGGMPGMPQMAMGPTTKISSVAPAWMFALWIVLVLGGLGTGAFAYDEAYSRLDSRMEDVERSRKEVELHTENVERIEAGKKPPEGCPETELNRYSSGTCHGCKVVNQDPSKYSAKSFKRKNDWLDCDLKQMKSVLEAAEMSVGYAENSLDRKRREAMTYGGAAAGTLLLGVGLFVVWLMKNKVMRAKRKAELAGFPAGGQPG